MSSLLSSLKRTPFKRIQKWKILKNSLHTPSATARGVHVSFPLLSIPVHRLGYFEALWWLSHWAILKKTSLWVLAEAMPRICSLFSHAKKPWYHSWMHSCNLWSWKQHRWRNLPAEARVKSRPYMAIRIGDRWHPRDVGTPGTIVLFLIQALLVAQVFGLRSKEETAMQGAVSRTASAGWD